MATPALHTDVKAPSRRIAGWMPAGMLDWPGRLSATVFLAGCSLRCPFCHNPQLLSPESADAEWSHLESYLRSKTQWLDGVVVTGGEPTDDPSIVRLLKSLADIGYEIKLDTNGTNPEVLELVLGTGLVSYVALDVKTTLDRYDALVGRPGTAARFQRTLEVLGRSGVTHEFRTTAYPGAVSLDDLPDIAAMLSGGHVYAIQQFVPDTTLDPRAGAVLPFRPDALHETAARCARHLPTIVRGA